MSWGAIKIHFILVVRGFPMSFVAATIVSVEMCSPYNVNRDGNKIIRQLKLVTVSSSFFHLR